MVGPMPINQQEWTCAKCRCGLPPMDRQVLRKYAIKHLQGCSKLTMMQNRKLVAEKGLLKQRHANVRHHLVKARAVRLNKQREQLQKKTGHTVEMVQARFQRQKIESASILTCTTCTSTFGSVGLIARSKCCGRAARQRFLKHKRHLWADTWRHDPEGLARLCAAWGLTSEELRFAEGHAAAVIGRRKKPPPIKLAE